MHRCAILDDYQNVALKLAPWERLAGRVEIEAFSDHLADPDAVAGRLADFDIVVAMRERTPFGRALVERLPKLKLLITTGARNASFDLAAAKAANIVVCGTRSIGSSTAEHTFALILALARNLPAETASVHGGEWQVSLGTDLAAAKLGLIGLGRLGSRVVAIAKAFGMDVAAWSPNLTEERCRGAGVAHAGSLDVLLGESDFVSIHLVLAPATRGLIGARELSLMKPTARLINTSRGPIVDESALIAALAERRIAAAALDVFDLEPLPAGHPFRSLDNVLATPHIGYVTERNYRLFYGDALEDIDAWLAGAPVRVVES
jgi:phosphoglycerate dehydrogenase-like enzyme